jgi:hypothetical protein
MRRLPVPPAALALLALLAAPAAAERLEARPTTAETTAQTLDRIAEAEDIPLEEWRAMAMGRTLTYRIGGEFWALERYVPGTDQVVLQFHDGTCLFGTWTFEAPHYCFHWEGEGTSCFRHARHGEDILIIETIAGIDTGSIQTMTEISNTPLTCGPAVTS